jgi:hypothetical protein
VPGVALLVYAFGVALGALTIHALSDVNHHWNKFWQQRAHFESDSYKDKERAEAARTRNNWYFFSI